MCTVDFSRAVGGGCGGRGQCFGVLGGALRRWVGLGGVLDGEAGRGAGMAGVLAGAKKQDVWRMGR